MAAFFSFRKSLSPLVMLSTSFVPGFLSVSFVSSSASFDEKRGPWCAGAGSEGFFSRLLNLGDDPPQSSNTKTARTILITSRRCRLHTLKELTFIIKKPRTHGASYGSQSQCCSRVNNFSVYPRYARNALLRDAWRKRRIAFSFICRTRSRVKLNFSPISSSVSECSESSPK